MGTLRVIQNAFCRHLSTCIGAGQGTVNDLDGGVLVLAEALTAAGQITWEDGRAEVLAALASPMADLPLLRASTLLQEVLPVLARRSRHELLADLRVLLAQPLQAVNGAQVSTTAESVIAVGNWWP